MHPVLPIAAQGPVVFFVVYAYTDLCDCDCGGVGAVQIHGWSSRLFSNQPDNTIIAIFKDYREKVCGVVSCGVVYSIVHTVLWPSTPHDPRAQTSPHPQT